MLIRYQTPGSPLSFEFEAADTRDIVEHLSKLDNVFGTDNICGMCQSTNIRWVVQEHTKNGETNTYREKRCECKARLKYGSRRVDGELFPRKKDAQGRVIDHDGWERWEGSNSYGEAPQYAPPAGESQVESYPPPPSAAPSSVEDPF